MKRYALFGTVLMILVSLSGGAEGAAPHCGQWRWGVKTLQDAAAAQVNMTSIPTTVEALRALAVPGPLGPNVSRFAEEMKTYSLRARLLKAKQEADSDFHLVLAGSSGKTMVAEIPSPSCIGTVGGAAMRQTRAGFLRRFGQPSSTHFVPYAGSPAVTMTGVLFFDEVHGQAGVAPNGMELHPVLGIR